MTFKERVENNPFFYLATAIIGAVSIAAGLQQYFYSQQRDLAKSEYQRQVDDANSKLASIKRSMPDNDYFDIRKLQYTADSHDQVPSGSRFFSKERFYATADSSWEYSVVTEKDLMEDLTGKSMFGMPGGLQKATTISPVHLWRTRAKPAVVEKHTVFTRLYPFVSVQELDFNQLHAVLGFAKEDTDQEDNGQGAKVGAKGPVTSSDHSNSTENYLSNIEGYFRNDIVGSFFTMTLFTQMVAGISGAGEFSLLDIRKVGNVLYSQHIITLRNIKVDRKDYERYYIRQEYILISASDRLFVIHTFVPSDEPVPRGDNSSNVTKWLTDFRALIS